MDYTPHDSVVVNAVLCREVLEEKNGLITPVRLFENIDYPVGTNDLPEFFIVCVMKCFNAQEAKHAIGVHIISPSGEREVLDPGSPVTFGGKGEDMPLGLLHIVTARLKIPGPGAYWLEIWIDGKFGTRLMIFFRSLGNNEAPT